MSIRVDVKKHYKQVLPKVKGYRWTVDYLPEENILGNVAVLLWRNGFMSTIVGSSYALVRPTDSYERARQIVRVAAEEALQEALGKGVQFKWGKPVAPDNITGK